MTEELREKIARTPIKSHRYEGKRYLTLDGVDGILALIKEAGYVKLADNQSLPSLVKDVMNRTLVNSTLRILKVAGWRKVEC